uniref:EOG090X0DPX n=1 Tax=Moina brachiata TaxID=675436 RepID=A0A4Y7NKY4_9CRUS|nr:EOG090X0DPX [Moina brachiata]SVE93266.1 EOG090X0DPX [Moina brachiata]
MDPLFKNAPLSPLSLASSLQQESSDESDERTSFVRSSKAHRKYGSTTSGRCMNDPSPISHSSAYVKHQVRPGDTLVGIALRYQTTVEYIKRINKMWTNDTLFLREYILVPSPINEPKLEPQIATLVLDDSQQTNGLHPLDQACNQLFPELTLGTAAAQSKSSLARTNSSSSASNTSVDCEKSIHDYLGSIDNQIKEAKSKAQSLQNSSDVLKDLPDIGSQGSWPSRNASARLRYSLSDLGGEFNTATSSSTNLPGTAVVNSGRGTRKSKSMYHQRDRSQDEIFELRLIPKVRKKTVKSLVLRQYQLFAEFVEGKSHLSDNEVLDYETTTLVTQEGASLTDDESDED